MIFSALVRPAVVALCLCAGAGCLGEAPRDNPVDPGSDLFVDAGSVTGLVSDRAGEALAGADVVLLPGPSRTSPSLTTRTDVRGRFTFADVPSGADYRLQAHKEGYAEGVRDSVVIRVGPPAEASALALNALPAFSVFRYRTVHISRWWPEQDLFFLEVEAEVQDADGLFDIDDVGLEIPDLAYTLPLEALTDGRYEKVVPAESLPVSGLQPLLGRSLLAAVRDRAGDVTHSDARQLARVIDAVPVVASPRDDVLLATDRPVLAWDPFPATYAFTYRVDVFRDEVNRDVLALQLPGIALDALSYQLESPLPAGAYFWMIAVVDAFGNESRSKEAAFRIP